eukprot:INCI2722.2.p1 GENE.INCI2722.2~~INCI2722.2.p1  ORF type:complete len:214 (-),score=35.08 INCI2722.2:172-813(-)
MAESLPLVELVRVIESVHRILECPDVDAVVSLTRRKPTLAKLKTTPEAVAQAYEFLFNSGLVSVRSHDYVVAEATAQRRLETIHSCLNELVEKVEQPASPPAPDDVMLFEIVPEMMLAESAAEVVAQPPATAQPKKSVLVRVARLLFAYSGKWIRTIDRKKCEVRKAISATVNELIDAAGGDGAAVSTRPTNNSTAGSVKGYDAGSLDLLLVP